MNAWRWLRARNASAAPALPQRVKLVIGAIALCILLFGVDYFVGWPDWLTRYRPSGLPDGAANFSDCPNFSLHGDRVGPMCARRQRMRLWSPDPIRLM